MTQQLAQYDARQAEWDRMTPRQRDAWIDVHAFGRKHPTPEEMLAIARDVWTRQPHAIDFHTFRMVDGTEDEPILAPTCPRYSTSAEHDYRVLEKARLLLFSKRSDFVAAAWPWPIIRYEPGFYSRAWFLADLHSPQLGARP